MAAVGMALIGVLALLVPTSSAAADELTAAAEPVAEVASVAMEPAPEPEPAPVEADAAAPEAEAAPPAEAAVPEEPPVTEEAPVAEEAAAPTSSPAEPQPDPEPQPEPSPSSAEETEGGAVAKHVASVGKHLAPVPAAVERVASAGKDAVTREGDVAAKAADLLAALEPTLATPASLLQEVLAPLEALSPDQLGEAGDLAATTALTESTGGSTGPALIPDRPLPDQSARLPEPSLPAAIDAGPRLAAPTPIGAVASSPAPSAPGWAGVLSRARAHAPLSFSPSPPVFQGADRAPAAKAAWTGGPAKPLAPERSPSDHSRAGSGAGGSSFIPLLGVLALLALVPPRGYRRRMSVRGFPAPTPFVCALERPG